MSDFSQNGVVCTIQRLNESHLDKLDEQWLPSVSPACPVSLILPCHGPDLAGPALPHICRELSAASWLHQVLIPINGLPASQIPAARAFFHNALPDISHSVFLTDHPDFTQLITASSCVTSGQLPFGKGMNVWAALGVLAAQKTPGITVLQDCDVLSFHRPSLARLCYAVANPEFGFEFAKMYYSRVTDRLYGRVSRLFLSPLLHSLIHVAGHHPFLDFLQAFRYPLAGECALKTSLAAKLPIHNGWALEIGMLAGVFREIDPSNVCQIDGGTGYDHKHQPASSSLQSMCAEIGIALLQQLQTEGCKIDTSFLTSVSRALKRECSEAVRRSVALSKINGIPTDAVDEQSVALSFAGALPQSLPPARATLPAWELVERTAPDTLKRLLNLVTFTEP